MSHQTAVTRMSATSMLTVTAPHRPMHKDVLQTPGGFGWLYLDLVDDEGSGVVAIAACNLPFLPRPDVPPSTAPSINLAVYERGVQRAYLLLELPEARFGRDAANNNDDGDGDGDGDDDDVFLADGVRWRVHRHRRDHDQSLQLDVELALDLQVPGLTSISGRIQLHGVGRRAHVDDVTDLPLAGHDWSPQVGPTTGQARLRIDGEDFVCDGRGYHDRNASGVPMTGHGIRRWWWARTSFGGNETEERLVYALWPEQQAGTSDDERAAAPTILGLRIRADGATERVSLRLQDTTTDRHRYGLELPRRACFVDDDGARFLEAEVDHRWEAGPFYARGTWRARSDAGVGRGVWEVVDPTQIDVPWQRPFVAMRALRLGQAPSWWSPLFLGDTRPGLWRRLRRLMRFWRHRLQPSSRLLPTTTTTTTNTTNTTATANIVTTDTNTTNTMLESKP